MDDATPAHIARAARALSRGENVVVPTETVYGLGANALDARAVLRIFEIKGRPRFNPLIVHVGDEEQLARVTSSVPDSARALMERFWPGPLTLVLPRHPALPDIVTAGLATVAVRMPDHAVTRELLRLAGVPMAAPSANPSGEVSPTEVGHIAPRVREQVAAVLDGGPCRIGLESTILAILDGRFRCLRPGGLELEKLEKVVGRIEPYQSASPLAPGMLSRHYAPATRCRYDASGTAAPSPGKSAGLLSFAPPDDGEKFLYVETLSRSGDCTEAAARLFGALRRLDSLGLDEIVLRPAPAKGLGIAINDRLTRAAAP